MSAVDKLVQTTKYPSHPIPHREDAPAISDCLTAVWYAYHQANVDLSLTYLGDMPKVLLSDRKWSILSVSIDQLQCGDLLFLTNRNRSKLISHIALVVNNQSIFHCSREHDGGKIEKISSIFLRYEQVLPIDRLISYSDPRSRFPRKTHQKQENFAKSAN